MKKILFIVAHRLGRSPGQRFRFEQYLSELTQNGFTYEISYLLNEKEDHCFYRKGHYFRKFLILLKSIRIRLNDIKRVKEFDVVFIYREAVMFGSTYFENKMKKKGAKLILDFDDAIWLMDVSEGNKNLRWLKRPSKTAEIIALSDMVFIGNSYLASYAKQFNANVKIVPTTLVTNNLKTKTSFHKPDKICIGWTGSSTTLKHFGTAIPFLKKLNEIYPDRLKFKLISDITFETNDIALDFCRWNKETETDDLLEFDIGIMPLPDDEWSRGKCGFKGLQYMALGIPTVMSPVGVNVEIINDGVNGFLAETEAEWVAILSKLIDSEDLRQQIGLSGKKTLEESYSYNAWKNRYVSYFEEMLTK